MKPRSPSLLIVTEDSPDSYGPAGERAHHLAIAGRARFKMITVLTLRQIGPSSSRRKPSESPFQLLTVNFSRALPFPLSNFLDPVKVLILLIYGLQISRRIKPTHVFASMPPLETGICAWLIAKIRKAQFVIDLRDDWESAVATNLKHYFPEALINVLYRMSHTLYSSAVVTLIATQVIGDNLRIKGITTPLILAPNGADTAVFYPRPEKIQVQIRAQYSLPRNKLVVVYSGSGINPYYRLDLVFASMKKLPRSAAEKLFFLFYLYNGHAQLRKLQQQLEITPDQLEIRSPLPRKQLAEVTSACDIGLVPFDAKSYLLCARSTKMYEYLGCGLFTVSSGPQGGELDAFFSGHPELGLFTSPTASDFARILTNLVDRRESLFDEHYRRIRYEFIRMNYDRQILMRKALGLLTNDKAVREKEAPQ